MPGKSLSPETVQYRGLLTVCAMAATLMQSLDSTIANVALPYMQGSLSASSDQITWVLTSYIVAAAIMAAPVDGFRSGSAMAVWGMGMTAGPILGPTLGGYLTEFYNWRYVFFVNLPFGLLATLGVRRPPIWA